jgi:TIR domain
VALKVFISYSSRDRPDALRLKEIVESDGHDGWMDLFDIHPAARLAKELEQGVLSADILCLLLSPSAVESPWVRDEIGYALTAEAKGLRVMPVIVRASPIPEQLADVVAIDATRGLDDPAVALRIRRALGGDVEEGVVLDAVRRAEFADRAAVEAAEAAFPTLRESLDRVLDEPIRKLSVTVDQDTWPGTTRPVIEFVFTIDIFQGALSILLATYVEGHTWRADAGIDERPPDDFFGAAKPRVDARLLWAGRTLTATTVQDGTDLGERPLELPFELPGDEYTGEERATTMALLTRFELPPLRKLIDGGASVAVWLHPPSDGQPERVDPATTDLRLRLEVPLRVDEAGIYGFRLWSHHDRMDEVLWRARTLQDCSSDLEREALLSLYRNVSLRAEATSSDRRERIAAAVESGAAMDDTDRWAAFRLSAGRADVPRLRGQVREAAQYLHEAVALVSDVGTEDLDYGNGFALLRALTHLVEDLARAGGSPEEVTHNADAVVNLARRLSELHPEEPDYRRALARNLMLRAGLFPGTPGAVDDVRAAVAAVETLVREDALPWRLDEARDIRERVEALVTEWGAPTADDSPEPAKATGRRVAWLDPGSAGEGAPLLVFNPLLRFGTRLPPEVPWSGPTLSVADAELLGVWGDEAWGAGLVVGLSELQSADDVAAGLATGRPPNPLPGAQEWELVQWQEDQVPAGFVERLGAGSARAFLLRLRSSDRDVLLRGYLLLIEKQALRWRVCLTLEESGDDWRARAAADAVAAVVLTRIEVG